MVPDLTNQVFCFTGKITDDIPRSVARAAVLRCGGSCTSTVARSTTVLVVGTYPGGDYCSEKLARANALIEQGQALMIMPAATFLELMNGVLDYQLHF